MLQTERPPLPVNVHGRLIETFYPSDQLVTAGPGRRLAGWFLDALLSVLTLGVGWFVWFLIVAGRGQTPGKQLLGMYIVLEDGTRAGWSNTILREVIIKWIFWVLSVLTLGILTLLGALWCLWDRNHQCLWDKLGSTYVGLSRNGFRPMTRLEQDPHARRGAAPVVVGVFAVLLLAGSIGGAVALTALDSKDDSSNGTSTSTSTRADSPVVSGDQQSKLGDLVKVGSLDLTVVSVDPAFDSRPYNMFNSANVAVRVRAANTRGDAGGTYNLNSFLAIKVVDDSGIAYTPELSCAGCPEEITSVDLTRGGSVEGNVYFEIPAGKKLIELRYEPLASRNKARISLQ